MTKLPTDEYLEQDKLLPVLRQLKLNQIQLKALKKNLNKVRIMMKDSNCEFNYDLEDVNNMIIRMWFYQWEQAIVFRVCPWKILSKNIVKWK